jgi:membrane protease YdiL (CAAX protease family)
MNSTGMNRPTLKRRVLLETLLIFAAFYLPGYFGAQPESPAAYMPQYVLLSIPQVLLVVYILWLDRDVPLTEFGFRPPRGRDWIAGAILLALLCAVLLSIELLSPLLGEKAREAASDGYRWRLAGPALLPLAFVFSVTAGYKEEIFYRAYLLTRFRTPALPVWTVVAASSVLFCWGHVYQGITAVVFAFVQGLIFCLAFLKIRNVHVLAAAHGLYNFVALLLTVLVSPG